MKKIIKFIYVFLIIGLESFGNMSAVTVVLEENLIKKNKWINQEDLANSITVARLGPGATTANMVAFLGNKIAGVCGGILATICYTILPMVVIICAIEILDKIVGYSIVMSAIKGSLACICALFIKSSWDMGKNILNCKLNNIIFGIALILTMFFNISGILIIICSIFIAVLFCVIK